MTESQFRSRSYSKDLDSQYNKEVFTEVPHRKSAKKIVIRDEKESAKKIVIRDDNQSANKIVIRDENQRIRSKRKSKQEVQNRDAFDSTILLLDDPKERPNTREISDEEHHLQEYVFSKRGIEPEDVRRVRENGEFRRTKDARDSRRVKDRTSGKREKEKRKSYPNEEKPGSRRTRTPRRTRKPSPVRSSSSTSWTCYDENNDSIAYIVDERLVSIGVNDHYTSISCENQLQS